MYGWQGTILRVDLSNERVTTKPLDEKFARGFIGGRGFNSMTLFREINPGIDPLGAENVLCLAPGPFSGTSLSLSSRVEVSTLSPQSCILGDGNAGGSFAAYLKKAGYDQIVITGKAPGPKYLWIDNRKAELRDASPLMGLSTWETTDALKELHGKDISVACIGQAGENLVRFATTIVDKYSSAARGSGAVLGSKNLKAIAVRGNGKVEVARPEEFSKLAREDREFFLKDKFHREVVAVYGTHIGVLSWYPGFRYFEKYLSPEEIPENLKPPEFKKHEVRRSACYGCVVGCKNIFEIPSGRRAGEQGGALEYEGIHCLGINCGVLNPIAIMEMENLADKYGMCVIGLGNVLAFTKELYNRGIISGEDAGGLSLEWEDDASQIELIHRIALREGIGNPAAEGIHGFARILGGEALDFCYHVKGLSRGPHPAGIFGLAHATSTRGADHLRGRSWAFGENDPEIFPELVEKGYIPRDPVGALLVSERAATLADLTGRCKGAVNSWACTAPLVFKYPLFDGAARLLSAATGIDFDEAAVEEVLDRVYILEMAFNARQGITRRHDRLPQKPEVKDSPEGRRNLKEHEKMLTEYYHVRGCDPEMGIPKPETLKRLGLEEVSAEMEASGGYSDWQGPSLWPLDKYPHGGKRS